ncbi:MAG: SWIM zinc finger family protein [Phycisphaerales bacterium]
MGDEKKPTSKPAAKKATKKASKKVAKKAAPAKKPVSEPASKPASKPEPKTIPAPAKDREVNMVARPTLSANVPTAPKKIKPQYASFRSSRKSLTNPRRVRGGVKLKLKPEEQPSSWITQRLLRVAEEGAPAQINREGLEYARAGQTKRLTIEGTLCEGIIQGRSDKPYKTELALKQFTAHDQEQIIGAMGNQMRYAAKLLAGELPSNIEDVFAPLELRLFPTEPSDLNPTCSCPDWSAEEPWCKHAVCLTALLAERLGNEPMDVFGLHGMPGHELIDGLRQKRAIGVQGPGPAPVLVPHIQGVSDISSPPLEDQLDSFWTVGEQLDELDTPMAPPAVQCVLLRRLGPSPFLGRFPLVGLMQTCYELIGSSVMEQAEQSEELEIIDAETD